MTEIYKGYQDIVLDDEAIATLYEKGYIDGFGFLENEYLIARNSDNDIFDSFVQHKGKLERLSYCGLANNYMGEVEPRNAQQKLVIHSLLNPDSKVKVIKGVYGSGKDYLMLAAALQLIEKKKFDKLIFVRPNVTVRGLPEIGALPGTADEKLAWTLAPLYDKVGGEMGVQMLIQNNMIESVPLLFIRGRSFAKSIIYVTEGQNMTTEIAKLVLGRIGEGSELWINADTHQTDKGLFDKDNGVDKMISRLTGNKLFSYVYMPKTERSEVAELASLLDD